MGNNSFQNIVSHRDKSSDEYLVSIVVPTKNRYCYLKELIKLIDDFKLKELELVIQDNSDDNIEIVDFLRGYPSPDIKYYYSTEKLTMSENGELAIFHATGEYVCYIGDDDGVCRNIVDCVKWMKSKSIEAAYNGNVHYSWNGTAKLQLNSTMGKMYRTQNEIHRLLSTGFGFGMAKLPLIYHGIVKKTVLDKIRHTYGTLFPSVPPDISGSICLSMFVDSVYSLKAPVIINGASQMTGGGVIKLGGVLPLEKVPFISQKNILEWEPTLPPLWAGQYAWAESGIKTLRFVGLEKLIEEFDIDACLARAVAHRPYRKDLRFYGKKYAKSNVDYKIKVIYYWLFTLFMKIRNNLPGRVIKGKGIISICNAEKFFMKSYNKSEQW